MSFDQIRRGGRAVLILLAVGIGAALPSAAHAANGAFAVDDSDTPTETQCKVESWVSFASNSNFIAATAPACAINFGHVVEFSAQVARFRADGEWGTSLQTKAKTNLIPSGTGKLGIGLAGGTMHDLVTGETTGIYGYIPFTYGVTDELKLLVNTGILHDRVLDQNFFTWGVGFEWNFVKPLTLIAEVYGQIGPPTDPRSINHPRFQAGLRYTPVELVDIDVIYGRNITGENANWVTVGLNLRFPPAGK
jgi:hypothetical protein